MLQFTVGVGNVSFLEPPEPAGTCPAGTIRRCTLAAMLASIQRKFLVVDALAGVQTFTRQLLQSHGCAAAHVLCCADTESALAQGLSFKPDVLITDSFTHEVLSGLQLFERLHATTPGLQLALLCFEPTPELEREAQSCGAHFLLKKPFKPEQLRAAIQKLMAVLDKQAPARVLPVPPPEPVIKPGDSVRYNGSAHVVQYVVHRQGATVVQLKGQVALIPVAKLQPL